MYVKTAIILSTIVASYYGAFYACTSLQACIACAVMLGIGMGEVGVSIMHDANHGAYCNVPWVTWLMSATLDAVGASSFMWRQQHVVGHHVHTNVEDKDPDIRVSDPDVRRVTPKQPWQPYHVRFCWLSCWPVAHIRMPTASAAPVPGRAVWPAVDQKRPRRRLFRTGKGLDRTSASVHHGLA